MFMNRAAHDVFIRDICISLCMQAHVACYPYRSSLHALLGRDTGPNYFNIVSANVMQMGIQSAFQLHLRVTNALFPSYESWLRRVVCFTLARSDRR